MSAHTPGPWTDESGDGSKWGVFDADGRAVALAQQIVSLRVDVYQAERTANARLIAAAPELLAALVAMNTLAKGPSAGVTQAQKREVIAAADAAIAKAMGVS
jgi:hypothetical protein